jgi:hypothetical protein
VRKVYSLKWYPNCRITASKSGICVLPI